MHEVERRLQMMINPLSSAFTRWWCHSAARYILTGYGKGSGRVLRRVREGSRATSIPEPAGNAVTSGHPPAQRTPSDRGAGAG